MSIFSQPISRFHGLLQSLGIVWDEMVADERIGGLHIRRSKIPTEALAPDAFVENYLACDDGIAGCFEVVLTAGGEDLYFDRSDGTRDGCERLMADVAGFAELEIAVTLHKDRLLEKFFPGRAAGMRLFLFAEAFESSLRSLLGKPLAAEENIWAGQKDGLVCILILNLNGCSRGPRLIICGDDQIDVVTRSSGAAVGERGFAQQFAYEKARDKQYWEEPWVTAINPSFFRIHDRAASHSRCLDVIDAHALNLALLFLAHRSFRSSSGITARFATDRRQFEVSLLGPTSPIDSMPAKSVDFTLELVEHAYRKDRLEDRLRVTQAAICSVVPETGGQPLTAGEFLRSAFAASKAARWSWASFISERVMQYSDDVKSIEKAVDETVDRFDQTSAGLFDDASKGLLGAIGAVFAAYVAARATHDVSSRVFRAVIIAYGLYLLLMPGIFNSLITIRRFRSARRSFEKKISHHSELLGQQRTLEMVGQGVDEAAKRFRLGLTLCIVTLAFVLLILAGVVRYADYLLTLSR